MAMMFRLLLMALVAAYLGIGVWLYWGQDDQIFPRTVNTIENPAANPPPGMELPSLQTPDGATLNGLLFNAQTPSPTLVIAFGGNAHDVTGMVRFLRDSVFNDGTATVAGFSYRGYPNALGRPSTGHPSQAALMSDALLIVDTLVAKTQPAKVVVVGYSLGTAMATHVAAERPVHAAILAAPFASLVDIAQSRYTIFPASWMVNHPFRTEDELPAIRGRVTIVASEKDGLIPAYHPARLLKANPSASLVMLADPAPLHGDVLDHPAIPEVFRKAAE
jgi:pimeloyl-ACP methyl ester carboxylesterase